MIDMNTELISHIIHSLVDYNRMMYDHGRNTHCYGTQHKLRTDQIHMIDYIGRNPCCRLGDIAAATNASLPTVSLQVKRLSKLGIVRKERSEANQREVILTLTEDGETVFRYHTCLDQQWMDAVSKELSAFSTEDLSLISRFLKIILKKEHAIYDPEGEP